MRSALQEGILTTLSAATGITIGARDEHPPTVRTAIDDLSPGNIVSVIALSGRFMVARHGPGRDEVIVAGPYRYDGDDMVQDLPVINPEAERYLFEKLRLMADAMNRLEAESRERLELANQLEILDSASMAVTIDGNLPRVLRRLADLACQATLADLAVIHVSHPPVSSQSFVTSNPTGWQVRRARHQSDDPEPQGSSARAALPTRHGDLTVPEELTPYLTSATSYLNVPVVAHDRTLGDLYLLHNTDRQRFTDQDTRIAAILARYAALAIWLGGAPGTRR